MSRKLGALVLALGILVGAMGIKTALSSNSRRNGVDGERAGSSSDTAAETNAAAEVQLTRSKCSGTERERLS